MIERQVTVSPQEIEQRREFMLYAALQMGERAWAMIRASEPVVMERKPDNTIVTTVDKTLNRQLMEMVAHDFPSDLVWGEEESNSEKGNVSLANGAWLWTVDPIDGTNGFWRDYQMNHFSSSNTTTLIAGFAPGAMQPTISLINNPFNASPMALSADPSGAYYHPGLTKEPRRIKVLPGPERVDEVERYDKNFWPGVDSRLKRIDTLMPYARRINHPLGYAALALGDCDLGVFPGPSHPHDVAPAAHIIHAAGGTVTTFQGERYEDVDWRIYPIGGVVAAGNQQLTDDFLERLVELEEDADRAGNTVLLT